MNADYIRPFLSPKTNFLCHANLKVFSPLMSAARGPKPSVAPKPKVTPRLNGRLPLVTGSHEGCTNGGLLPSDNELEEENEAENSPNKEAASRIPAMKHFGCSSQKDLPNSSQDHEGEEEDVSQKMEEDWRLSDSALTEEVDSSETLWVSDAGLTADSEDAEEMIEMDMTEDMVMDGCDAGEALADTEGLSVGDISVTSVDEEAECYSGEKVPEVENQTGDERQTKHQIKEDETADSTADDLTESLTEEEVSDTHQVLIIDGDNNEAAPDCGITCRILKLRCSHKMKEKEEFCAITVDKDSFIESVQTHQKKVFDTAERCIAFKSDRHHEPYYVSSEDIITTESNMRVDYVDGRPDSDNSPHGDLVDSRHREPVLSEDYVDISGTSGHVDCDDTKRAVPQDRLSAISEENKFQTEFLNSSHCELRFGFTSMLSDFDTSLTSSASESQVLSLSNSDVFTNEDFQGCRGPFLDDTTDTEPDLSDEPVYEDTRHRADSDNSYSFNRRSTGMRSRSHSQRINNHLSDTRLDFFPRPSISGFQAKPTMSSSPMLNKIRYENYSKPNILSLYPRSLSMEDQDMPLWVYKEKEASLCSSGSFSRCSPLSSSGFSTPTSLVDIPPPFELACITKRPITKSFPSLLIEGDSSEKNRKKKSSIKHFLMKFRRKSDSKPADDVTSASSKSSAESRHQTSSRMLDFDRHSLSSSPQLNLRFASKPQSSLEPASSFSLYKDNKSTAFFNRSVVRVESFEDRSRVPFTPLPLTKPRSISFPNTDTSDYENVPPLSSDYENLQVPRLRPVRQEPFKGRFERSWKAQTSANDTDGYVDMSSLHGFDNKSQSIKQETESAYTETYNMCSLSAGPLAGSMVNVGRETADEESQGQTSEEEERWLDINYDRLPGGRSRAFYIAKELGDTERLHVQSLKLLQEDFREAVGAAVGDEGEPVLTEERLREILNELPDIYTLHRRILTELENRIKHWEESQRIADIFLSRRAEFLVFTTYIGHYDRSMNLLDDSCLTSPGFALTVHQFEQSTTGGKVSLKHQLLKVIIRVAQYRMLLMDYLNNLSPDSKEYEDTQAAVVIVTDIADQVNDSLKHGENLLRLVNIEYSVRGQWDLLRPGRVFVKEGTLMKVSRTSQQPRHLFLMNDVLLYTYPQQDGKYRLKNTFSLTGLKVSKPMIENVQNTLKVEGTDASITLSASSFLEREDWFYTLSRTVAEHARGPAAHNTCSAEVRDSLRLSLGEKAPTFVPVSHVMMCMNCTSDFSLTLRRHHCHSCGRIVCRSCSRNRYPLKYMKDRMAKVCDHCYNELKKRGGDVSTLTGKNSPRPNRSSRPLSSMFQNIHPPNIWRHRKGAASLTEVTVSEEGSISGSLQRSKRSRRTWKRLWFLLKDKVLYTYRAQEETVASESLPLLGFTVKLPHQQDGEDENTIFQLYHKNTLYYTFKAEDNYTAQRWVNAMEEATVL